MRSYHQPKATLVIPPGPHNKLSKEEFRDAFLNPRFGPGSKSGRGYGKKGRNGSLSKSKRKTGT